MYKLIFEKRALDQLNKLETQIKKRIWNKLQDSKKNPFRYFEKLKEIDGYKLRIGNYRVIADIDNETITVLKVGHRKNIYDI
tara:strand:- start:241 stop:486 length:246 start_codon:yes stop_codon:yes gene_type:complete